MKPLTEIKKGCGKVIYLGVLNKNTQNENEYCNEKHLCPTCQALLEQAQEFEKIVNDWYIRTRDKKTYVDLSDVQELLKEVRGDKK